MSKILLCVGDLTINSGVATCQNWQAIEADIIVTPAGSQPIDPASLILAAGTGVAVIVPLAMTLFGIKMAKKFLIKS